MNSLESKTVEVPDIDNDEIKRKERAEKARAIRGSLNDTGYQDFLIVGLQNKKIAAQLAADEARKDELLNDLERDAREEVYADENKPEITNPSLKGKVESPSSILKSLLKKLMGNA